MAGDRATHGGQDAGPDCEPGAPTPGSRFLINNNGGTTREFLIRGAISEALASI